MVWRSEAPLLAGKTALVTGATRGIGWEVARTLAAHGAKVAVGGRDALTVAARAAELAAEAGVETLAVPGDVARAEDVKAMIQAVFKAWKQLDVLVNNAGVMASAPLGMIDAATIDQVVDVNVKGALHVLQGAARLMQRHKRGAIVNVASIVGTEGAEGQTVYAASKAALVGLTYAAAKELAPHGIRVNAVAPGYIETELVRGIAPPPIGLGRIGTPDDVARVVLFLVSDQAAYVTGQVLGVDGGLRL